MQGPLDTPYENGVFELYCQFGPEYPVKPPLVRFVTQVSFKIKNYWNVIILRSVGLRSISYFNNCCKNYVALIKQCCMMVIQLIAYT